MPHSKIKKRKSLLSSRRKRQFSRVFTQSVDHKNPPSSPGAINIHSSGSTDTHKKDPEG